MYRPPSINSSNTEMVYEPNDFRPQSSEEETECQSARFTSPLLRLSISHKISSFSYQVQNLNDALSKECVPCPSTVDTFGCTKITNSFKGLDFCHYFIDLYLAKPHSGHRNAPYRESDWHRQCRFIMPACRHTLTGFAVGDFGKTYLKIKCTYKTNGARMKSPYQSS